MGVSTIKTRIERVEGVQAIKFKCPVSTIIIRGYGGDGKESPTQTKFTIGTPSKPGITLHRYRNKLGAWTEWSTEWPPAEACPPMPAPSLPQPSEHKTPDRQRGERRQREDKSDVEPVPAPVPTSTRREQIRLTLKLQAESNWRLNNERL